MCLLKDFLSATCCYELIVLGQDVNFTLVIAKLLWYVVNRYGLNGD